MTHKERVRRVKWQLSHYAQHKKELADYENDILYGTPNHDNAGIRGSYVSDPSARKGIALTEMPKDLEEKARWCSAIEDGIRDLREQDKGKKHGLEYICMHAFGVPFKRQKHGTVRIAIDCETSRGTVYYNMQVIVNTMMYHAIKAGLLDK